MTAVRIDVMPGLAVEYVTRFGGTHQVEELRPAEAIYLPDQHRLIVRSQDPTRHLARELALCIAPHADLSTTAPSILEILVAETLAEAMLVLDEYGVRDLEHTPWGSIQSSVAIGIEEIESQVDGSPIASPTDSGVVDRSTSSMSSAGPSVGMSEGAGAAGQSRVNRATGDGADRPQRRSRGRSTPNTSRLTSYVGFGESERGSETGDEADKRSAIDRASVGRVLVHEVACGRLPEEQSHNNPGFDVLSRDADAVVLRRIEIKSIGGPWTDRGVLLSSTQFEDAREHPDL